VNLSTSPSPYSDLSVVIRALRGAVGGWGLRGWLSQALVLLVYRRLGVISGKMERLSQRFQAGRLWRIVDRVVATAAVAAEAGGAKRAARVVAWPRRFGWLVRCASYHAAGYGCQLREILGQPEMVALLLAAPQAGRILRPMCRMLAVETSLLRPRPEGEASEIAVADVAPVVKTRVRVARKVVDWGRIPLPRGVLSAARRQGFGKGG
jgi:hypothetical protein